MNPEQPDRRKKIGYIRLSAKYPEMSSQLHGIRLDEAFIDKDSVESSYRPTLRDCLQSLRKGDVLYVQNMNRISLDRPGLLGFIGNIRRKEAAVYFVDEKLTFGGVKPYDQFADFFCSAVAAMERSIRSGEIEVEQERKPKAAKKQEPQTEPEPQEPKASETEAAKKPSEAEDSKASKKADANHPKEKRVVSRRGRNVSKEAQMEICRLRRLGMKREDIANLFGLNLRTVGRILEKYGLTCGDRRLKVKMSPQEAIAQKLDAIDNAAADLTPFFEQEPNPRPRRRQTFENTWIVSPDNPEPIPFNAVTDEMRMPF